MSASIGGVDSLSNLENLDKSTLIAMVLYHRKNEERQKQAKLGLAVAPREVVSPAPSTPTVEAATPRKKPKDSDSGAGKDRTPRKSGLRGKNSVVQDNLSSEPNLPSKKSELQLAHHDSSRASLQRKKSAGSAALSPTYVARRSMSPPSQFFLATVPLKTAVGYCEFH